MATKEEIQAAIGNNDKAVYKALVLLYARQTYSEKAAQTTTDANSRGFSYIDAEILSSFAEQVNKGWTLSPKQMALARKRLPKYWKQLLEEADLKEKRRQKMIDDIKLEWGNVEKVGATSAQTS